MSVSPTMANIKASNHELKVKGFEISGTSLRFIIRPVVHCSPRIKKLMVSLLLFFSEVMLFYI